MTPTLRQPPAWSRAAAALATLAWAAVAAAAPVRPLDVADQAGPAVQSWSVAEGLSEEIWNAVEVDAEGFVWAGSASGIARFDGYRWTPWTVPGASSLVRDMARDGDGRLWAAFEREGLFVLEDGQWRHDPAVPGLVTAFAQHIAPDGRLELWAAHEAGVSVLRNGRWIADPRNGEDTRNAGAIVATRRIGGGPMQWMMRRFGGGLWQREQLPDGSHGPWRRYPDPVVNAMALNAMYRTEDRGNEEIWVLSYGDGIARIDERGVRFWRAHPHCGGVLDVAASGPGCRPAELPTEAVYWARSTHGADGARVLWIASRAGLLRLRDDEVTVFDRRHGLPSDAVRSVRPVRQGAIDVLWLATEGGMARIPLVDSPWRTVSLLGAAENGIMGLLLEPDGRGTERLWVGTAYRGVGLLEDGQWRMFTQAGGELPDRGIGALWRVEAPDGGSWRLASVGAGALYRIDDRDRFVPVPLPWPQQPGEYIGHVAAVRSGDAHALWVTAIIAGVHRYAAGRWERIGPAEAGAAMRPRHLAVQVDGNGRQWIWAAGDHGLWRLDEDGFRRIDPGDGVPGDAYRFVAVMDHEGRQELWIGTGRHGLLRFDASDPTQLRAIRDARVPEPPDATVYSVLDDGDNRVYLCTNNGVQQLRRRGDGGFDSRVFRRRDGLVHDECNTNGQFIDEAGRYWVGTLGGLSVFDPRLEASPADASATATAPIPVRLTAAMAGTRALATDAEGALLVPAGTRELRLDYTLLTGLHEADTRYRSQLAGLEDAPGPWTPEHSRSFSALPPGEYLLRVEARDHAGAEAIPLEVGLVVDALWWQQRWVQAAFGLLLLLSAMGLVLLYNRGLRLRERRLRSQVAERTAELSEANERLTELSFQDPLTGLANRRRLMEALGTAIERARGMQRPVGLLILDVDHFKQYNDRHGHLAGDAALRAVAQAMVSATRKRDLVCRFGGEEFACLLLDADAATVAELAERMRALIQALPPRALGNDEQTITASIGALSRLPRPTDDADALLAACDAALYEAKRGGRNRVCRVNGHAPGEDAG